MTSDEITVYLTTLPVPEEPMGRALLQLSATVTPAAIVSTNLSHSFWYKPAKTKEVFLIKLMIPLPRDGFSWKLENKAGHRTLRLGKVGYHVKSYVSFRFSTSLFSFLHAPSPHPGTVCLLGGGPRKIQKLCQTLKRKSSIVIRWHVALPDPQHTQLVFEETCFPAPVLLVSWRL